MQFVGTHQLFGLLAEAAVLGGGQQFGADRRVQNVQQHAAQRFVGCGVGHILHNVAHQRFGNPGVDAVHAHVVTVVGGPAQRQLAQISGADDKTAVFVGIVHQLQCTHPGLAVFKGHVVAGGVLPDVGKMALHCGGDVDFTESDPKRVTENLGIGASSLAGAEAGHGDGVDGIGRHPQHPAGPHRHQQCQAGVQPARDAHHRAFGMGVFHPLGQALRLDAQDGLAALGTVGFVLGHKGRRGDRPGQAGFGGNQVKRHTGVALRPGLKAGVADALPQHTVQVQLSFGNSVSERQRLAQQGAVLGNQIVRGEYHVGGAFPVAGIGVEIPAQQPGTLPADQLPAIVRLADGLIAGRQVCHHRCACQRMVAAGGHRRPQVLAKLHPKYKAFHLAAGKQQPGPEQRILPGKADFAHLAGTGNKMAQLIKLAVIRQPGFGDKTQKLPAGHHGSAVVQLAVHGQRQPHQHHQVQLPGGQQNSFQPMLCAAQQFCLQKQIAAGVSGQAEFRQTQQLDTIGGRCLHLQKDLFGIVITVGNAQCRGRCTDRKKTVFHSSTAFCQDCPESFF